MSIPLDQIKIHDLKFDGQGASMVKFMLQGVARGLEPWRPDTIDLWDDFDIDFNEYRILARARGKGFDYAYPIRVDRADLIDPSVQWAERAYYEFMNAFRRRETWPVPDNIELGEY